MQLRTITATLVCLAFTAGLSFAGGSVSGTWDTEGSPYLIDEDIFVANGNQLEILADVEVMFAAGVELRVFGELTVRGTSKAPVRFSGLNPGDIWDGIHIIGGDEGLLQSLEYAIIEDSFWGVTSDMSTLDMLHCSVSSAHTALQLEHDSYATLRDCQFVVATNSVTATAMRASQSTVYSDLCTYRLSLLTDQQAEDGSAVRLYRSAGAIDSSHVSVTSRLGAHGINLIVCEDDVQISRTSVHNRRYGLSPVYIGSAVRAAASDLTLRQLSLHLETDGGTIAGVYVTDGSDVDLVNTILASTGAGSANRYGVYIDPYSAGTTAHLTYSCVYNLDLANQQAGFTYEAGTLVSGDPLWLDPDEENYHLDSDSPCINAGSPESEPDPDNTIADIGKHYFPYTAVGGERAASPRSFTVSAPYPNPFNAGTRFSIELAEPEQVNVVVFDVLGRRVAHIAGERMAAGRHQFGWRPDVASGVYLLRVAAGSAVETRRLTLIR